MRNIFNTLGFMGSLIVAVAATGVLAIRAMASSLSTATALTATGDLPLVERQFQRVAAAAAGASAELMVGRAPFIGTVDVYFTPDTVLTGADTDSRTLSAKNRGAAGAGTTVVASKAFALGTNAAAGDETVITASAVSGAFDCAAGDIISFVSTSVGGTGLAQPAGMVTLVFTKS